MMEVKVIKNEPVSKDAITTPYALMNKTLAVLNKDGTGEVWLGRKRVRVFKKGDNALIKYMKVFLKEKIRIASIYKTITKNGPIYIKKTNALPPKQVETRIGFDNVI